MSKKEKQDDFIELHCSQCKKTLRYDSRYPIPGHACNDLAKVSWKNPMPPKPRVKVVREIGKMRRRKKLYCPKCGQEWFCPCGSCKETPGWRKTFKRLPGDGEECLGCGLAKHMDWWENLELEIYKEEISAIASQSLQTMEKK